MIVVVDIDKEVSEVHHVPVTEEALAGVLEVLNLVRRERGETEGLSYMTLHRSKNIMVVAYERQKA